MTKAISAEEFQIKYATCIELIGAYLEKPSITQIINHCRLKPKEVDKIRQNKKTKFYSEWMDEDGNLLKITKNKRINIDLNLLSLREGRGTTDLYFNLPIDKVVKISKFGYFMVAKEEDFEQDYCLVSLLGFDNFLRSYCYLYEEWRKIPELYLGYDLLSEILRKQNLTSFEELKIKNNLYPCLEEKSAVSCLPASKDFISLLASWNQDLVETLGLKEL